MEKSKKLKLKRKIQQKQTYEAVNSKQEQNTFISADRDDAVAECVTLTSDSDNDPVAVSDKERKLVDKNTIQELNPNKTRCFLDVNSPDLRRLREIIMKTSRNLGSNSGLTAFPSHTCEDINASTTVEVSDRTELLSLIHKRVNYCEIPSFDIGTELSPFPAMCNMCKKRRTTKGHCNNKVTGLNINANCDKSPDINDTSEKLNGRKPMADAPMHTQDISHINETKDRDYRLNVSQVSNHCSPDLSDNFSFNNSHLMKDRNSNFYALQTRNNINKRSEMKNTDSKHTLQKSKYKSTSESESCNIEKKVPKLVGVYDVEKKVPKLTEICDIEQKDQNSASQLGNKSISGIRKSCTDDSSTFNHVFDSDSDFDNVDGVEKETHQVNCPTNQENKSKKNSYLSSVSEQIGLKHQSKITHTDTTSNPGEINVPVLSDGSGTSHSCEDIHRAGKETSIQSCPLCQVEFPPRTSQMDVDGHIAACLSAADDDVMW